MRVCVVMVVVLVCGVVRAQTVPHSPVTSQAIDCVPYGDGAPNKTFHQRISLEVLPSTGGGLPYGTLVLHSLASLRTCRVLLLSKTAAVTCTGGQSDSGQVLDLISKKRDWPMDILVEGEETKLWVQVGGAGAPDLLVVVGRRAGHQGHLILPSSGLLPPINIKVTQLPHYFNCVAGCKYGKSTKTQPGDHTVYLRPTPTFDHINLIYDSEHSGLLSLNLTSADLDVRASKGGVREIALFWKSQNGTIGAKVDGQPMGGEESWAKLSDKKVVEARVEGGGVVAACDLTFLGLAGFEHCEGDDGEDDGETTNPPETKTTPTHTETPTPSTHTQESANNSSIVGVVVILGFVILLALIFLCTTIIFAVLYRRASRKFRIVTGGSACITKRGSSIRKREAPIGASDMDDEDCRSASEVTAALSDTVMTSAPSPGSLSVPRSPKIVSSKEFVNMDLM